MAQLLLKSGYSLFLVFVVWLCVHQIWRVWLEDRPTLSVFRYRVDRAPNADAAAHFSDLLVRDLSRLHELLTAENASGRLIPTADQLGRGHAAQLITMERDFWEDLQIEAYGIKVSAAMQHLTKLISPPRQIGGTVDELSGGGVTVFATVRDSMGRPDLTWYLPTYDTREKASFSLACRIYLELMGGEFSRYGHITDEEFHQLALAAAEYERYRELLDGNEEEALAALEAAAEIMERLVGPEHQFTLSYKLAGYIERERGQIVPAHDLLEHYTELLAVNHLPSDEEVTQALVKLTPRDVQALELAASGGEDDGDGDVSAGDGTTVGTAPPAVEPGMVVAGRDQMEATICCVVSNEAGERFAVLPAAIVDPSSTTTVECFGWERGGDSWTMGQAEFPGGREGGRKPAFAIVALGDDVRASNTLPGEPSRITGIDSEPPAGTKVVVIGRLGNRLEAEVLPARFPQGAKVAQMQSVGAPPGEMPGPPVLITPVSRPGDAGAPVVRVDDGRLIGMLTSSDGRHTLVSPIAPFLTHGGLHLVE